MMSFVTLDEILAAVPDKSGWRRLGSGRVARLGYPVKLGNHVSLGDYASLGNHVSLGNGVSLGNHVSLGDNVSLGNGVSLGDNVSLGNGVSLGNEVSLGAGVRLCAGVKLGCGVRLINGVVISDMIEYAVTPLQVQCHPYVVYPYSWKKIGVGCVVREISYWDGEPEELKNHPECLPWSNYQVAIELVKGWIERNRP